MILMSGWHVVDSAQLTILPNSGALYHGLMANFTVFRGPYGAELCGDTLEVRNNGRAQRKT
jgi:hypothetical protein